MLVFNPDFFRSLFFLLIVTGSWKTLQPALLVNSRIIDISVLATPRQIKHPNRIDEHTLFNFIVQRGVSHKTWRLVNLNQPRLSFFVKKDIDSQDLMA